MENNKRLYLMALSSAVIILFLIMGSCMASAATSQSASPMKTYAYVANNDDDTVSVIDTATNTVTATVPVGDGPFGITASLDGTKVYVTNTGSLNDDGTISVIDTLTNKVTSTIDLKTRPANIVITPDGKKAYLTRLVSGGSAYVVDIVQNKILTTVYAGNSPEGLAVNPEGTKVYLGDRSGNAISIVDTATDSVTKTVNVGSSSCGVAVSPDGTKVYATEVGASKVAVIDTVTDTVNSYLNVGYGPYGVAVSPDGTKVYVTHYSSDSVSVIDTAKNAVAATVNVGDLPYVVSVTPDGKKVYVANKNSNNISVIDTSTNTVTATVDVGNYPLGVTIVNVPDQIVPIANFSSNVTKGYAPLNVQFTDLSKNTAAWKWDFGDGNTSTDQNPTHTYSAVGSYTVNLTVSDGNNTDSQVAIITVLKNPVAGAIYTYVVNSGSNTISVIDVATDTVIATIPVGIQPMGVAATPDGKKVYVTNLGNTISVIDTTTYNVVATLNASVRPEGLNVETTGVAVTPDGTKAYVTCAYNIVGYNGVVSVIDAATDTVIATVPVGAWPNGIAVSPDGKKAYVTNQDSDTVSVIDTTTNTVTATVNGLNYPGRDAVTPDGTKVYVLNGNNTVSIIDTTANTVVATLDIANGLSGIAFTPDGKKVYVATVGNTISVIDTATNVATATVNGLNSPAGVAVIPDGKKVYVVNSGSNTVSVIDSATNKIVSTLNVGVSPTDIGQFVFSPVKQELPVADFSTNVSEGHVPLSIQFTDLSKNAAIWNWDFGDGVTSNEQSPIHTFYTPGVYTVNLTVSNSKGTNSKLAEITVSEKPELVLPVANFSTNVSEGNAPLSVHFKDISANSTSRNWDFENDGIIDSTEETPVYVYTNPGTYTVNLTAINTNGTNSKTATIIVLPAPLKTPTITWSNPADITAGTALSSTQLNAVASDPVSGATIAGIFTYNPALGTVLDAGMGQTLHVDLTPTNAVNYNSASMDVKINVLEKPVIPVADFSASPTTGKTPLRVTFTDKSTGSPTSWSWNFGDKSTSTDQSPVHIYNKAGKYTVSLTVKNELGSNTRKISNYIVVKK